MKYKNKKSSRNYKYDPNADYDEGERRRGRPKKEAKARKKMPTKEIPPTVKKEVKINKSPNKKFVYEKPKTKEELASIKAEFVKRFNEHLLTRNQSNTGSEDDSRLRKGVD